MAAQLGGVTIALLLLAGTTSAQAPSQPSLCTLLPKAEVKALLGATDAFDRVEPRARSGKTGYACDYAGLSIGLHDGYPEAPPPTAQLLQGVGKQAFVVTSSASVRLVADLDILAPYRNLSITRTVDASSSTDAAKSDVVAIAKALIPKLK
jgi:hypothetical protein